MDFEGFYKIGIHFRVEELSEVEEVLAVDFLQGLELEHVGPAL